MVSARSAFTTHVLSVAVTLAGFGCASGSQNAYRLQFDHDVSLILDNDQTKDVKRGQSVEVPVAPMTVVRPDHKSVVLLPVPSRKGTLRVRLPKDSVEKAPAESAEAAERAESVGAAANKVAQVVIEIQNLLLEKRADEALVKIQVVRDRYPGFSYLGFLEASCFVIKNDLEKARSLVEATLKEFPDDRAGREFMTQITENPSGIISSQDEGENP